MNNNAASLRELVATRVPMYTGCGFIWSESDELSFVVNGGRLYAHRDEIMKCLNGKHVDVIFNTKVSELIACVEFCKGIYLACGITLDTALCEQSPVVAPDHHVYVVDEVQVSGSIGKCTITFMRSTAAIKLQETLDGILTLRPYRHNSRLYTWDELEKIYAREFAELKLVESINDVDNVNTVNTIDGFIWPREFKLGASFDYIRNFRANLSPVFTAAKTPEQIYGLLFGK